jgi:hypothetical protein
VWEGALEQVREDYGIAKTQEKGVEVAAVAGKEAMEAVKVKAAKTVEAGTLTSA